jgi:hypothetical protein
MARSKRSTRKIKGGEWLKPSTWSIFQTNQNEMAPESENPLKVDDEIKPPVVEEESEITQPEQTVEAPVVEEKPWYKFWGGKSRKAKKSKGGKTKKNRK